MGNMDEILGKYGGNMENWKYEGMWKYEGNMGAILVENMYTKQCDNLDHRKSKPSLLSKAKQVRRSSVTNMSIKFMGIGA